MTRTALMQKGSFKRSTRFAAAILQELSLILIQNTKDPNLHGLFLRRVEVTDDLRLARVYFSFGFGVEKKAAEIRAVLKSLEKAKGFFKRKVTEKIEMRVVPDFQFFHDTTLEHKDKMDQLFEKISTSGGKPDSPSNEGEENA